MISEFILDNDKIASIQCGWSHTLATTKKGKVYSWGEGADGQLGHGCSQSTRLCTNKSYPKKISKGIIIKEEKNPNAIAHVSCGKTINIAVMLHGNAYTWGRPDFAHSQTNLPIDSRPKILNSKVKFRSVAVGYNHCLLIDEFSKLWTIGDNKSGQLGLGDYKKRMVL